MYTLGLYRGRFTVDVGEYAKDRLKNLPHTMWNRHKGWYSFPATFWHMVRAFKVLKITNYTDEARQVGAFLKERYQRIEREAKEAEYIRVNNIDTIDDTYPLPRDPMWHQRIMYNYVMALSTSALLSQMGTGKTEVVLAVTTRRQQLHQIDQTLIACNDAATITWEEEARDHSDLSVGILTGTKDQRIHVLEQDHDMYVINFAGMGVIDKQLIKKKFPAVVVDESSKIKNFKTKRAKALYKIADDAEFKIMMTGSLISKRPETVFSQYRYLDANVFGYDQDAFNDKHIVMGGHEDRQIIAYTNLDDLHQKVYSRGIRFLKKDCMDLPGCTHKTRNVILSNDQKKVYKELRKNKVATYGGVKERSQNKLVEGLRFQQITGGFWSKEAIPFKKNPKMDALIQDVKNILLDDESQIVVWTRFTHELDALKHELSKLAPVVTYYGGDKRNEKIQNKTDFQTRKARIIIVNIQSGSMSLNLNVADFMLYYSTNYSFDDYEQSIERPQRHGQKRKVTCLHYTVAGTIDVSIIEVLKRDKSLAEVVNEGNFDDFVDGKLMVAA